jgi:hypothetical protein
MICEVDLDPTGSVDVVGLTLVVFLGVCYPEPLRNSDYIESMCPVLGFILVGLLRYFGLFPQITGP